MGTKNLQKTVDCISQYFTGQGTEIGTKKKKKKKRKGTKNEQDRKKPERFDYFTFGSNFERTKNPCFS